MLGGVDPSAGYSSDIVDLSVRLELMLKGIVNAISAAGIMEESAIEKISKVIFSSEEDWPKVQSTIFQFDDRVPLEGRISALYHTVYDNLTAFVAAFEATANELDSCKAQLEREMHARSEVEAALADLEEARDASDVMSARLSQDLTGEIEQVRSEQEMLTGLATIEASNRVKELVTTIGEMEKRHAVELEKYRTLVLDAETALGNSSEEADMKYREQQKLIFDFESQLSAEQSKRQQLESKLIDLEVANSTVITELESQILVLMEKAELSELDVVRLKSKISIEEEIDIFSGATDSYVPLGSTVPVKTRRALIAITTVFSIAPAIKRRK
jgi:hypothetical protein